MDELITFVGEKNSEFTEKYTKEQIESMHEDFYLTDEGQVFVLF